MWSVHPDNAPKLSFHLHYIFYIRHSRRLFIRIASTRCGPAADEVQTLAAHSQDCLLS
jgi:hypothetical protein